MMRELNVVYMCVLAGSEAESGGITVMSDPEPCKVIELMQGWVTSV